MNRTRLGTKAVPEMTVKFTLRVVHSLGGINPLLNL